MTQLETQILGSDPKSIQSAVAVLASAGLVAFPTETVYGLGADARNGAAVAAIYAAKDRPSFNPLIVHVANIEIAQRYAEFNPLALKIAAQFWPGPLSMVLPLAPNHGLSELVTAGLSTVAIRIPQNPVAQKILTAFDGPIAAPSANPSGRISPTSAQHVLTDMDGKIDAVIDGGPCVVGLESTIIAVSGSLVSMLRAGGISHEDLSTHFDLQSDQIQNAKKPNAPGQLLSHYAPRAALRLNATQVQEDELLLGFGADAGETELNLSQTGDLNEAAANLFAYLREMDGRAQDSGKNICVSPIPELGLGAAINDRLTRAAAPRD